jgi:lipoate-protein ligase A
MNGVSGDKFLKRYEYKVPGGKLLCAKVETKDNHISFIQITGDFFLLPETDLEDLETQLVGMQITTEKIKDKVINFFNSRNTIIAGASPKDFAYIIERAIFS